MKIGKSLSYLWGEVVSLFFPRLCPICQRQLMYSEPFLCQHCLLDIPETGFHRIINNRLEQLFWRKVPIEKASAYFYFSEQSDYRTLIHAIKYRGEKEIGFYLGALYGQLLAKSGCYSNIDYIVPVPLHQKKLRQRGYNQSEYIARGVAFALGKEVLNNLLVRKKNADSQTHKSVYDRWENTQAQFEAKTERGFADCHFLLVDDVITTGATLQACSTALLSAYPDSRISIVTLAAAE